MIRPCQQSQPAVAELEFDEYAPVAVTCPGAIGGAAGGAADAVTDWFD